MTKALSSIDADKLNGRVEEDLATFQGKDTEEKAESNEYGDIVIGAIATAAEKDKKTCKKLIAELK